MPLQQYYYVNVEKILSQLLVCGFMGYNLFRDITIDSSQNYQTMDVNTRNKLSDMASK